MVIETSIYINRLLHQIVRYNCNSDHLTWSIWDIKSLDNLTVVEWS